MGMEELIRIRRIFRQTFHHEAIAACGPLCPDGRCEFWSYRDRNSLQVSTRILYNFAETTMALEVENNGDFTEAVGFDMTLSKEEFISAMSLAVDGTPWTSRFVQRSHKEIMSQETLDISKSAVRLNLTPRYKHGTLYQMAVKVPPKKTVKYVVKSLRLLERQENKYRYEVQVSFEHQVEMFSAETTFLQSVNFFLDPLKSFTAEEITDITNEGNLSEGELKKITVKWKLNKNSIKEGKTLRWAVGYTRKTTRSPGFCAMGEDGYFVHFVNVKNRYKVRTSIIIVLDKSASMYPEKIKKVKSAMTKMIEKKVLRGKYNILTYGNDVAKLWTRMRNIDNLRHTAMAKNFIRSMQANGMANINQALMDALTLLKKGDTKRSLRMIIFLTDGSASGGHQLRTDEIVRNFTTHNTLHCPVFGLAYGENADLHFLKSLAARSSGFVRFIEETDQAEQQIEDSVREIISVVIKDMEVEYKPPLRGSVTKTYHPYILNGSEHLICGHYSGSKLSFTYRISGLHHTTGKIKTWRSRPFKCHVHRDLNGIAKLMLNYQELQEKISGKQGLEFQYLAQSLCQTSRSIFTFVTPCSTISFKTDQKNHETVKLQQLDLDLMIPVDFTFLNPYYPMNESQFPARYQKPKTTTTKEPKTTTTKEPKTTTTKEPKTTTTKEPKTTTTKEPKTTTTKEPKTTTTKEPKTTTTKEPKTTTTTEPKTTTTKEPKTTTTKEPKTTTTKEPKTTTTTKEPKTTTTKEPKTTTTKEPKTTTTKEPKITTTTEPKTTTTKEPKTTTTKEPKTTTTTEPKTTTTKEPKTTTTKEPKTTTTTKEPKTTTTKEPKTTTTKEPKTTTTKEPKTTTTKEPKTTTTKEPKTTTTKEPKTTTTTEPKTTTTTKEPKTTTTKEPKTTTTKEPKTTTTKEPKTTTTKEPKTTTTKEPKTTTTKEPKRTTTTEPKTTTTKEPKTTTTTEPKKTTTKEPKTTTTKEPKTTTTKEPKTTTTTEPKTTTTKEPKTTTTKEPKITTTTEPKTTTTKEPKTTTTKEPKTTTTKEPKTTTTKEPKTTTTKEPKTTTTKEPKTTTTTEPKTTTTKEPKTTTTKEPKITTTKEPKTTTTKEPKTTTTTKEPKTTTTKEPKITTTTEPKTTTTKEPKTTTTKEPKTTTTKEPKTTTTKEPKTTTTKEPKTTTTKEPKTTTTKEPKTTTTKEPKITTTKEPKTTTTKEPKTKPQKDLRTTKTNRPQIVREGILKVMTIEFPTKSPLFKAGNGICIISKKWYSREYKLLQDEHSGLQIIHAYCYRYKLCGKSSILMHYEGKTLRVNLTRKTRWSISTEPSGETFGLREESKNRTHLKFVKPGEIIVKLSKYRATEKGKSYDHFKLHVKFLSSVPSNKKRLSGMLGIYLTRIRDAVRETDKLCKDFSFTFYVKRKTIEEFVIRRLL
ncbi:hypothetical protein RRG08_027086 [Elysia crispata]|uniref:VWFA domain-containing protein n=1 Tax=Elysia crispata TaxID=231223 RepID=A0AAE0XYS9_9GAST|nr:hypothetical protein RRG08_027086 [Elysia crispata]